MIFTTRWRGLEVRGEWDADEGEWVQIDARPVVAGIPWLARHIPWFAPYDLGMDDDTPLERALDEARESPAPSAADAEWEREKERRAQEAIFRATAEAQARGMEGGSR